MNNTLNSTETFSKINSTEEVKLNDTVPPIDDTKKSLKVVTVKEKIDVDHQYLFVSTPQGDDDLQTSINK